MRLTERQEPKQDETSEAASDHSSGQGGFDASRHAGPPTIYNLTKEPNQDPEGDDYRGSVSPPTLNLKRWFKTVKVVNLDRFPKRWEAFCDRASKAGITGYEKFSAIEGDKVNPSGWFRSGNGAWGCLMSHLRIAQDALMEDTPGHLLVFEDDALFSDDFAVRLERIMAEVGEDWDMLYLGGQHLHVPRLRPHKRPESKEVINAKNINRTHAFAVNKRFLQKYQKHIMFAPDYINTKHNFHIDHQLGNLHENQNYKILCAQPWICGQAAGKSWTSGRETKDQWWQIDTKNIIGYGS